MAPFPALKPGPLKPPAGVWQISEEISKIDDSKGVTLTSLSTTTASDHGSRRTPRLLVSCSEGNVSVVWDWGIYLGLRNTTMTTRLDKSPAVTRSYEISSDAKAVGRWRSPAAKALIGRMVEAKSMVARITPYNENPEEAVFDLTGLADGYKLIRAACPRS